MCTALTPTSSTHRGYQSNPLTTATLAAPVGAAIPSGALLGSGLLEGTSRMTLAVMLSLRFASRPYLSGEPDPLSAGTLGEDDMVVAQRRSTAAGWLERLSSY